MLRFDVWREAAHGEVARVSQKSRMLDEQRFALHFGPYSPPQFQYGDTVMDEVRGEVKIVGLSDAKISWPIGKRGRAKSLVVFSGLAKAVAQESNQAVCH